MKKWFILLLLCGLGAGGYYGWKAWQKQRTNAAAASRLTTAEAELRSINFAVNAAGEISPSEQVSVRPEINGKLEKLPVDVSDRVKKGDLVMLLSFGGGLTWASMLVQW